MENERKLIQFYFINEAEIATHYHQNPELFYILAGQLEVKIDDQKFLLKKGGGLLTLLPVIHYFKVNFDTSPNV